MFDSLICLCKLKFFLVVRLVNEWQIKVCRVFQWVMKVVHKGPTSFLNLLRYTILPLQNIKQKCVDELFANFSKIFVISYTVRSNRITLLLHFNSLRYKQAKTMDHTRYSTNMRRNQFSFRRISQRLNVLTVINFYKVLWDFQGHFT